MEHLALRYAARGMSVIPLDKDRHPLVRWKPYQSRAANPEQVKKWLEKYPGCNWAIVTGAVNGIVVLDLDSPEAVREARDRGIPSDGPVVRTRRGWHLYFAHPGKAVPNKVNVLSGMDLRGDGGYAVAPPSVHPSGVPYRWARSIFEADLPPMPEWVAKLVFTPKTSPVERGSTDLERIAFGVNEGERNVAAARLAGYLLSFRRMNPRVAAALLEAWNERNNPPLPLSELYRTIDSIAKRQVRKEWGA